MYKDKKIIVIIPARGGSKGIPHKNIVNLCGKPLISYSIHSAKKSKYIDYIYVSTDDKEIANVAIKNGATVPFLRPKQYSTDKSNTIDCIIYSLKRIKKMNMSFDVLVLLQPTSPLRTTKDIDDAIETFFDNKCKSLASVCEVNDNPRLIRKINCYNKMNKLINENSTCRRQDMDKYYRVNGAIYINNISELNESTSFNDNKIPFIMNKNSSIDIDDPIDLEIAKLLMKK